MEGQNDQELEGTWNKERGRNGQGERPLKASGCCGNGPKLPVKCQEEEDNLTFTFREFESVIF